MTTLIQPRYSRKVIRMRAEDSPNVRRALMQIAAGGRPDHRIVTPGVVSFEELMHRERTWDPKRTSSGLYAEWYKGAEVFLFPEERLKAAGLAWRDRGAALAERWMGVDPAQGGDRTAFAIVDRQGLVKLHSILTPNTNVTFHETLRLIREWNLEPRNVLFDMACGKEHVDRLRADGCNVRAVSFGEAVQPPMRMSQVLFKERLETQEDAKTFSKRRVEMYWELAPLFDPDLGPTFCLPPQAFVAPEEGRKSLAEQLKVIPREYDDVGRPWLRPKQRRVGQEENAVKTLSELIGHSPDEADALVLAVHGMLHPVTKASAGAR